MVRGISSRMLAARSFSEVCCQDRIRSYFFCRAAHDSAPTIRGSEARRLEKAAGERLTSSLMALIRA
jgi:hypothetical protein